jgi:hypothetical protein
MNKTHTIDSLKKHTFEETAVIPVDMLLHVLAIFLTSCLVILDWEQPLSAQYVKECSFKRTEVHK